MTGSLAEIEWTGSYSRAFQRSLNLIEAFGAELRDADPNRGYIRAGVGITAIGAGFTVEIHFQTTDGVTTVRIQAAPAIPGLDLGAGRRFVARFAETWKGLPAPPAAVEHRTD